MEGYIAEIRMFAGTFAPKAWAFCAGQLLSISQNTALFSLLGTTYGGNGQTTFGLPDFRGRVAVGTGSGPGLSPITLGEVSGSPTHTLIVTELAAHNHLVAANANNANDSLPASGFPSAAIIPTDSNKSVSSFNTATDGTLMNQAMIKPTGGNQPFSIMQPYLGMNYIICLQGIYPSRN